MNGIVGGKQAIPNMILALFKVMIHGGWNSHREASNTKHNPGPVEDAKEEKEMIPGGWNRQRKTINNPYDPGSVEGALEEEVFPGGWNGQIETNNTE